MNDHPVPKLIQAKPVDAVFPMIVWAFFRSALLIEYERIPHIREEFRTFEAYFGFFVLYLQDGYVDEAFRSGDPVPSSWIGRYPCDVIMFSRREGIIDKKNDLCYYPSRKGGAHI